MNKLLIFSQTTTPTVQFNAVRPDRSVLSRTIYAGSNRLTQEELDVIQAHPSYSSLPAAGRVEILDPAVKGGDFESLEKFSEATVFKIIHAELNINCLAKWLSQTTNSRIAAAINEQIQWLERLGVRERQIERYQLAYWFANDFKKEAIQQVKTNSTSYTF